MQITKIAILGIAIVCLTIFSYYVVIVIEARSYTEEIVKTDLANRRWRIKGENPRKFQLGIDDLSEAQLEALLYVQDPAFYQHSGVDLVTPGAGITTITQAIAKKLYFESFKPGLAKLKQALIAAVVINPEIEKREQLEIFINLAYLGNINGKSIYGFENAASEYYKKPFAEMNYDEFLSLVAMLIAPNTFSIAEHPDKNKKRVERIKALISGSYIPKGLMDLYYGDINIENSELPKFSKF